MFPPLFWLVLTWLMGIALAPYVSLPLSTWLALAGVSLVLLFWRLRSRSTPNDEFERLTRPSLFADRVVLVTLAGVTFALGGARQIAATPQFTPATLATYNDLGEQVTIEGVVSEYPQRLGARQRLRVAAERVSLPREKRQVEGDLIVNLPRYPTYQYGDRLRLVGLLETPPRFETFDYRAYLARKGIYSQLRRARAEVMAHHRGNPIYRMLYGVRVRAEHVVGLILPEPHAALMSGILLGIESGIPDDVMEDFNATGTTHIIVISGFNIAILAGIFLAIGERLVSRKWAVTFAVGAILAYTLLVGADAAVTRAAIMGIVYILARGLGRQSFALASLAAAAFLMTLLNPAMLYNLGFQLSSLATLALILFVPSLTAWTEARLAFLGEHQTMVMNLLNEALLVTIAAQLLTTPLVVSVFGRLSLVSLLTNLLILPVQAWVMLGGGLATIAGLAWLPLGRLLAWIPWAGLTWTFAMVEWTARLPYASVDVIGFDTRWLLLCYGLVFGGWAAWRAEDWRERLGAFWRTRRGQLQTAGLATLAVAAAVPWLLVFYGPDGRLHLTTFDVGQGDAIFIETPDGKQVLIDGGEDPQLVLSRLGDAMPPWDRSLDLVVATHPDEDHLGGLPNVLNRYDANRILDPQLPADSALGDVWTEVVAAEGARVIRAQRGQQFDLGRGVHLEVLGPPTPRLTGAGSEDNNNSVVLRLRYGAFCALLTADAEAEAERELVRSGRIQPCGVLKVGHHGSDTSTTPAFLAAARPRVALISAGADNRFGHPSPEVVARLEKAGVRVLRTDQHGTIELITDGRRTWVRTSG